MKIVVFGGSGFLGSHVADALTEQGHDVLIFDKAPSPYINEHQKMIVGDVMDEQAVLKAVEGMDVVYNFTAVADIEEANANPLETAKVNIVGNVNVLEAARKNNVKRFVFSSSIYIYSDSGAFYRSSKQASELFIEDYAKIYNLDYTILRYGSLYGPRSTESNWVYKILNQALTEGKIVREGNGEEIREYIHVLDAAKISAEILAEKYKNKCAVITGNERMRIKDLLTMIKEILKGEVDIEYVPVKINEHYQITPYTFNPKIATKITTNEHLDMGQGILHILGEIHQKQKIQAEEQISSEV